MVFDTLFVFCVPYQRRLPFGPCIKLGWRRRQRCSTERWGKTYEIKWRHVPLNINLYRHRHINLKSQPDGWPPCCQMTCSRHTRKLAVKVMSSHAVFKRNLTAAKSPQKIKQHYGV